MNLRPLPPVMPASAEDREAPSSVVHACASQARWHLISGLACWGVAGCTGWIMYTTLEVSANLILATTGRAEKAPDSLYLLMLGGLLLLCAGGVLLLRSHAALLRVKETRLLGDLHRALRRVRTVWVFFAVAPALWLTPAVWLGYFKTLLPH
jgi:hypothetical protein